MKYYKVNYHKDAIKFIKKNKIVGLKFLKAFEEISQDKNNIQYHDIIRMEGYDYRMRLRIGKYRAMFEIIDNKFIIYVIDIASRGEIYK